MTKRSRILAFGSAVLLVVAGVAAAVAFSGTSGQVLAFVLISLGLVLATALVFLEVGLGEDRERAREARQQAVAEKGPQERRRKDRLERSRGSRRRLR